MATRKKTITVPVNFGNVADLANNTLTTIGTPTIYIPENSVGNPVTFTSVCFFTAAQDTSTVTGATITTYTNTLTLAGAAASSVSISAATLANSGENWGGLFGPVDYTTYFNTNYGTVTSKVLTVQVLSNITTGTGTTTRGVYGYLEITYTYDDSAATRIKTICIPYESQLSTLSTTVNTTFSTMPQLTGASGWLNGYAGVTIRNRWIEIKGNCNNNNTVTNFNLSANFDSGTAVTLPTRISALGTDTYQIYQVDASALSTNATHTFQLWSSLASRFSNVIVNEWITFEYTVSGSSRVLNYIEVPVEFNSPVPGTTSAVALRAVRKILISEPGTITMRKCSVEIDYNTAAAATVAIKAGSQASFRSYAQSSNVVAGMFSFQHGIDASSALGSAFTIARGENSIVIDLYRSVGSAYNTTGMLKLLYESDVSAAGIDTHTDVRRELIRQMSFTTTADDTVTSKSFQIPESNYWIHGISIQNYFWMQSAISTLTLEAAVLAGEADGAGWRELFVDTTIGDTELGYGLWNVRARPEFKVYPQTPDTNRLNIESARSLRTTAFTAFRFGSTWVVSYNNITDTVSGTISGSTGGTVNLSIYRSDTDELIATSSITGDGSYSFVVYDNTLNYYVVAYEDATHKGVSKSAVADTNFNISLSGGSSAVTTGYAGG